jgi:hypothetical protein
MLRVAAQIYHLRNADAYRETQRELEELQEILSREQDAAPATLTVEGAVALAMEEKPT